MSVIKEKIAEFNEKEDCDKAVETAAMLSAPIIRVWAGQTK